MESLTFEKLREANALRCGESFHPIDSWSPTDWACAMAGEAGEACNVIKKIRRGDAGDSAVLDAGHEIADMVIYADLLCQRLGLRLEDVLRMKFNMTSMKVKSRVRV